jgi:hypothetical protein
VIGDESSAEPQRATRLVLVVTGSTKAKDANRKVSVRRLERRARRSLSQREQVSPSELVNRVYEKAIKCIGGFRGSDRPTFRAWLKKNLHPCHERDKAVTHY